jgi:hypothetical protein
VLAVERRRRLSQSRSLRRYYWLGLSSAVIGVAAVVFTVIVGGWVGYLSGGGLLMSSAGAFLNARELRRRRRLYGDDALSEAGDDVLALVRQGRKIEAIKRYRELHPGIGLREAKGVVDGCARESAG